MKKSVQVLEILVIILLVLAVAMGAAIFLHSITNQETLVTTGQTEDSSSNGESVQTTQSPSPTTQQTTSSGQQDPVTTPQTTTTATQPGTNPDTTSQKAEELLSQMTLFEKVCQMFIVTPEALVGGSQVTTANLKMKQALSDYPVGGIVYFSANLQTPDQVRSMLSSTQSYAQEIEGLPLFLCVDEEGGTVARIGNNAAFGVASIPNMSEVSKEEEAYQIGLTIGAYLADLGFNLDFAPVADVLTNSQNTVVLDRSFGSDPVLVSTLAWKVAAGIRQSGLLATYKHFPGQGATAGDTHVALSSTDKTLEELLSCELLPFADGIEKGIDLIMVGHIALPNVTGDDTPASLSPTIVTNLLREKMGYEKLIITDSLSMNAITNSYSVAEAAVLAVQAGNDLLLMPDNLEDAVDAIVQAVEAGTISEEQINQSVLRILSAKLELAAD
jgi:beta-N-acetylhexosaminidase